MRISPELRSRLLALGILLGACVAAWLLVVEPVAGAFADQRQAIAQSRQLLAEYEARIAARPLVEARLAALRQRESETTGVVAGRDAELAGANVQNAVKALIQSEQGQIRSAQPLAPTAQNGFERVDIEYDVSLPMARLSDTIYRLETSVPYLFIDGVDMRAPDNGFGQTQYDPPNLEIRWTIHGFRWAGPT